MIHELSLLCTTSISVYSLAWHLLNSRKVLYDKWWDKFVFIGGLLCWDGSLHVWTRKYIQGFANYMSADFLKRICQSLDHLIASTNCWLILIYYSDDSSLYYLWFLATQKFLWFTKWFPQSVHLYILVPLLRLFQLMMSHVFFLFLLCLFLTDRRCHIELIILESGNSSVEKLLWDWSRYQIAKPACIWLYLALSYICKLNCKAAGCIKIDHTNI